MGPTEIKNPQPALAADCAALGAAVKAIILGGSALGDDGIKRVSGLSDYTWHRKRDEVLRLVRELEGVHTR